MVCYSRKAFYKNKGLEQNPYESADKKFIKNFSSLISLLLMVYLGKECGREMETVEMFVRQ
jgi:hypothetical protein